MGSEALTDRRYERQRRQLIETIRDRGIDDLEVLRVFDLVPRHRFVPDAVQHRAYEDAPVPIGFGQTASQPSLQALYLQLLKIQPDQKVLEIGTGSGFQTALLAHLAAHVYSIERIRELSSRARTVLDELRYSNIALLVGDGTIGWSRYAPYDAILVAAASPGAPQTLIDQLSEGGRMLIPVGDRNEQTLTMFEKKADAVERTEITACTFVPLLGRFGWAS
jgi:protein-L-isoaspartate(D-aspartate) O-methyltransferase